MVLKGLSTRYTVIKTFEEVKKVVEYCKVTNYCSYDFETKAKGPHGATNDEEGKVPTGPQYIEDEPTMVSISFQPHSSYVIPLFHFESPFQRKEATKILEYLGEHLFENRSIVKVGYNLKFELRWLIRYGLTMKGPCLDMMLAKYLLNEERPNDLKSLVAELMPEYAGYEEDVRRLVSKYKGWANVPLKPLARYNAMDSDVTLRLVPMLEKKLIKNNFYKLFRNMCMPQTFVLAESESMGMCIDKEYLDELIIQTAKQIEKKLNSLISHKKIRRFQQGRVDEKIKKLIIETKEEIKLIQAGKPVGKKKEVYKNPDIAIKNRMEKVSKYIAGNLTTKKERVNDFNPGSPDQMVDLLFNSPYGFRFKVVKYTKDKKTKKPTKRPSTDEEALLVLKNKDKSGFVQNVLDYREITKLYSTYMVAIQYRLTSHNTIHGSFLIHGTVTGRLSSKNPNLQNIPRSTTSSTIKKMYVCPPGHLLLEVDYGQAELRVAAELSGDEALIDIFKQGYNLHLATACKLNNCYERYAEIKAIEKDDKHKDHLFWIKEKKKGKVLNFSVLFGQSDYETANQMGVSVDEAREFKAEWFRAFPRIKPWMKEQAKKCKRDGYVYNLFGRKRRLPDIYSPNDGSYNKAVRDAINAPIQGSSSDFTQLSTIMIRDKVLKGELIMTDNIKYIHQAYTVHDSIGFYVQPKYLHKVVPVILDIMMNTMTQHYFGFKMKKVKMKASPSIGITWGELRDYNPTEDYDKLLKLAA